MIQLRDRTKNILLVLGLLFVCFLIWRFSAIVTYVLISVVLAFIGKPLVRWLILIKYKGFRIGKGLAAFVTLVTLWVVFISFFRFVIPLVLSQLDTLSQIDFTAVMESIEEPIQDIMSRFNSDPLLVENKSFMDVLYENIGSKIDLSEVSNIFAMIAGTVGELLIAFFSISFITFFFMKEENMFRDVIILLVPTDYEKKVRHILDSISHLLRRYFIGLLFEVFMVMLLDTVGLTIVGIDFNDAVVIGLICGLFNVIPYLGPWMGATIGLLIGAALNLNAEFASELLPLMGWMILVFGLTQVVDNVLLQPLIYSSSVKAHPMEIFLVILTAGSMAGIVGMILAIPVYTILRVIAKEFFDNMKIVRKITERLPEEGE